MNITDALHSLVRPSVAAVALTMLCTACGSTQMTLQAPVSSATPVPIERSRKVITMGDVTITRTKGGMVKKMSGGAGPWGGEKVSQEFMFETSDGWKGSCGFSNGGQSLGGFQITSSGGLSCTLDQGEVRWDLAMEAVDEGGWRLVGTLSKGESSLDVRLSREPEKGIPRFVGYDYRYEGGAVASLQSASPSQLWLVDGTDPELGAAIRASVGALLFSQPAVSEAMR